METLALDDLADDDGLTALRARAKAMLGQIARQAQVALTYGRQLPVTSWRVVSCERVAIADSAF